MFETTGSLAIVQPVLTLVALVGLPLLWAILATILAQRTGAGRAQKGADSSVIVSIISITCAAATLGLALVLTARLALLPRGNVLFQHVSQLVRLGQLDLTFDLTLDTRSATFVLLITILSCASALHTAWSTRPSSSVVLAWTGLVSAGSLLLCIGDGFAPILIGLGLLSLGSWGLSRGGDATANVSGLAGNISILLGLVFLFWSLGGAFGPEGYDPDGAPRFVLVTTGSAADQPTKATLAMTTHAGALVSSDDADLPNEPVKSPFAITVDPGIYTLRVQGGAASGDVVVPRVALVAGRMHVLTPYGPTASFRVLDDQLAVPRLAPNGAPASIRASLANRTIGGLRASAIVLLLVLAGALAHAHALATRRGPSAIITVLEVFPIPYLGLRLAPLVDPAGADGALVTMLGAGTAFLLAARAACLEDEHRALRTVLGAIASVTLAAVGLGEPSVTLVLSSASMLGVAAALAAIDARRDVRWLGVACAAVVGLLPGAGASSGIILTITSALGSATSGSLGWAVYAAAVAAAVVITSALAALAAFRVYDTVIRASVREPGTSRGQGAVVIVLAVLALVFGTALGAGTTAFGGRVVPLAHRLAEPFGSTSFGASAPKGVAIAALVLSVIAAAGGVVLARRVSGSSFAPSWLLFLDRPYGVVTWTVAMVGHAAGFLERSVYVMNRDVVEDVPQAVRDVATRATQLARRGKSSTSRAGEGGEGGERLRTIVLLTMVVLLGLIVLSSFLLS